MNKVLIPELRFPEFNFERDWKVKELSELGDLINGLTYSPDDVREEGLLVLRSSNVQNGLINLNDRVYVRKDINGANLSEPNDILICVRNGSKNLIGKNAIIPKDLHFVTHGAFMTVFRAKNSEFVFQLFQTDMYDKQVKADLGATINSINGKNFLKYEFPVPENPKEQQKIADCLSSLDEVITAHSQKLDLLKDHKKGLMQNLFPQEGETVPKYRFPEFEKDGEWLEKTLGNCLLLNPEYGINAPAVPFSNKLPTYLRITDISEDGRFLSENKVSVDRDINENNYLADGDIVFARTGASVGKSYKYRINDGRLVFAGFLIRVKPDKNKLVSEFLFQFLSTHQYWKWVSFISARSGQPGINGTEYSTMPLSLPPTLVEQRKIASCFSTCDELITEQTAKIEHLRQHKKGLMQGLFPKIND
ncbi:MAG: hypothetical protein B7Z06_08305 [Flavobacteriales bacterium 32-35-8]|nr:MAG: hypothetical protein B7Z06_08305 [Flavobacteriales bacterium 32-35-8]